MGLAASRGISLLQGSNPPNVHEILARCLEADHMAKRHTQACIKCASGGEYTFAEVLESGGGAELGTTLDEMLVSFFEEDSALPAAGKVAQLLLCSSATGLEKKAVLVPAQWQTSAAAPLPGALLLPLARAALLSDEALFGELAAHPAFEAALKDDSGKGKAEADAPVRTSKQLLEALEICTAASDDKEDPVVKGVTFALTSGSLKEVLLVLLCLLHQDQKALVKALPFLRQLSFLEQSKLMEQALSLKMVQATIEQEDKISQVVAISGVNAEVARKALTMTNWTPDQAINLLMDNPAQVEQALEKDVLEIETRAKQNEEKEKKRLDGIKQGREKNLLAQLSRKKCFAGSFVQKEDVDAPAGVSAEESESENQTIVRILCHFDRLLVEMESPLKLNDAPLDKLHDGHVLSLVMLGAVLDVIVARLAKTKFGAEGTEGEDERLCGYSTLVLLRLLRKTLSAFVSCDESNAPCIKRQQPAAAKILSLLTKVISLIKESAVKDDDEPLQASSAVVPVASVDGEKQAVAPPPAQERVADLVLAEAIQCFQAGFHTLFATVNDRKELLRRLSLPEEASVWNRLRRIAWKECSRDFVAALIEPVTVLALLADLLQWEKKAISTLTVDVLRDVSPRFAFVGRLLFHVFLQTVTKNTVESNAKMLPDVTTIGMMVVTHAADVLDQFSSAASFDAASTVLRGSSLGRICAPVLLGLACLDKSQLLQCVSLDRVLNRFLASVNRLVGLGIKEASLALAGSLAEFAAQVLGEMAAGLVDGSPFEDFKVKPETNEVLDLPFFLNGRLEDGQESRVPGLMKKLCPWILSKGRGINDLLKARTSPEIDDMIVTVSSVLLHHAGFEGELAKIQADDLASAVPTSWMESCVRFAVGLKLTAMKELQNAHSKEPVAAAEEPPAVTMGSICAGYATRAKLLLQFVPCMSGESVLVCEENLKMITPLVQPFVTGTAKASLEEVAQGIAAHDALANQRETGFVMFRQGLEQAGDLSDSLRMHFLHHIKQAFAGIDRYGFRVLEGLDICRPSVKASVRSEFEALYRALLAEGRAAAGPQSKMGHEAKKTLIECLVFRVEENELPLLQSGEVLRILQRFLPESRDSKPELQMSGAAFPLSKTGEDVSKTAAQEQLLRQELSATALKVLVLCVAQVITLCGRSSAHQSQTAAAMSAGASPVAAAVAVTGVAAAAAAAKKAKPIVFSPAVAAAAASLLADIDGVVLSEFAQAVPVLGRDRVVEHGDTFEDCQQIVSSVKQFYRDAEGMYVPELIRSVDSRINMTFSLWLKLFSGSAQGSVQGIFFTGQNGSQYRGLLVSNRCLQYQHATKNGMQSVVSSEPLPVNEWVHVAVTTRARRLRIFVAGKQVAESKMEAESFDVCGFPLFIGTNFSAPARQYAQGIDGLVSNFRFLPRHATAEEIKALSLSGPILVRADDNAHQLAALILRTHALAPSIGLKICCDPYISLVLEAIENGTLRVQRALLRLLERVLPQFEVEVFGKTKLLSQRSVSIVKFLFDLASLPSARQKSDPGRVNASSSILGLQAEVVALLRSLLGDKKWAPAIWSHVLQCLVAGKPCVGTLSVTGSDSKEYRSLLTALHVMGGVLSVARPGQKVMAVLSGGDRRVGVVQELNPWSFTVTVKLPHPEKESGFFFSTISMDSIQAHDPDEERLEQFAGVPEDVFGEVLGLLRVVMTDPLFVEAAKAEEQKRKKEEEQKRKKEEEPKKELSEEEKKAAREADLKETQRVGEYRHLVGATLRVIRGLPGATAKILADKELFRRVLKTALETTDLSGPETLADVEAEVLAHQRRALDMVWCKKDAPFPPVPVEEADEDGSVASAPPPGSAKKAPPQKKESAPAKEASFSGFSFSANNNPPPPAAENNDEGGGGFGLFDDEPAVPQPAFDWGAPAPQGLFGNAAPAGGGFNFGGGPPGGGFNFVLGGGPPPPEPVEDDVVDAVVAAAAAVNAVAAAVPAAGNGLPVFGNLNVVPAANVAPAANVFAANVLAAPAVAAAVAPVAPAVAPAAVAPAAVAPVAPAVAPAAVAPAAVAPAAVAPAVAPAAVAPAAVAPAAAPAVAAAVAPVKAAAVQAPAANAAPVKVAVAAAPPAPAPEVKKGPTREEKLAQLRQAVPNALERDFESALSQNKEDVVKAIAWLKNCVQQRTVSEVVTGLNRMYPESWCVFALGKCNNSSKEAIAWLPLHVKDVVEAEADLMDMFSGEEAFRFRYFVDKLDNNSSSGFGGFGGGNRGFFDFGGGGGVGSSKLLRYSFERVLGSMSLYADAAVILSCRRLILNSLLESSANQDKLVSLVQSCLPPDDLLAMMRMSLFRGPELVLANSSKTKTLFDGILKLIWGAKSPFASEYRTCIIDSVVLQLFKLPNPEYAASLSTGGERFTSDSSVLSCPSMPFVEWVLGHLFGSSYLQAAEIEKIFGGLIASIRCGHMFVKQSVFVMITNLLRRGLENPVVDVSMYLDALPVSKILAHTKNRLAIERTLDSRATRTRYLSSLLDLVTTLTYFVERNKREKSTLRAPEILPLQFASTTTSISIAWLALIKPKVEANLFRKKSDVIYHVEMREALAAPNAEWRVVYDGSNTSVTRENLAPNTCYAFRLQARRGETESDWSSVCFVSTMGKPIELEVKDPKKRGDGLQVEENKRTVNKVDAAQSWRLVVGTQPFVSGLHYWEVYVDNSEWGTVALGVAPSKKVTLTNATGFCFANFRGLIGSNESLFGEFYGPGDTVGVLLDMDHRRLSFFKNRKPLGVAFSNMKIDDALPIFCLKNAGSKFTLMPESFSVGGLPVEAELNDLVDVGQVLMGLACKDRLLPRVMVRRAYNNWKVWAKQTVQRHMTRAGFELEINISRSKLESWKFQHGDRVSSPDGERIILGVHGDLLWHRPAKSTEGSQPGAWFWSRQFIEEWKSEIAVLEKSTWLPEECNLDLAFHKFEEILDNGWTMEQDAAICSLLNKCAQAMDVDAINVSMARFLKDAAAGAPLLSQLKPEVLSARAALIRELNLRIVPLLISASFENRDKPWSLGWLLSQMRDLFFLNSKESAFRWLLDHTTQQTSLRDDEYTDPSNLMTIAVNREKAQRYAEDTDPEKRKRWSLFFQTQERFRQMGVSRRSQGATANLRQRYTGILDAGQSRTFKITFQNEGVTDNGGPYREIFSHFCSELHSTTLNLLVECPNARAQIGDHQEAFVFNCRAKSKQEMDLFHFMGQMIGIAIRCDIPLEMRWPKLVWKRLVGLPPVREDVQAVDEALFHVINDVASAKDEAAFAEKFGGDLFFCVHTFDGQEQIDLIKGGGEIPVTFATRMEWIDKVLAFKLSEGVAQMDEMILGLSTIVPASELAMFSCEEIERKICGAPHISIGVLRANVVYDGIDESEQNVKWLWEILDEMSQEQRALFLQFVWARSRLPVLPSQMTMKFKIQSAPESINSSPDDHLPLAHTCFFSLALPQYSSKEILRTKLLYACMNCRSMDSDFRLHSSDLTMSAGPF